MAETVADPALLAIKDADTLEEAIGIGIGAASMCWDNIEGAGVFDSQRASLIVEMLLFRVREYVR